MRQSSIFSGVATWVRSARAIRHAAYVVIFAAGAAVFSFGQAAPALAVNVSGPYSFKDTPVDPSYRVTVTNTSQATVTSIRLNHTLSAIDSAYLIVAQPSQGTCQPGGTGITFLSCSLGDLDPGATINLNVAARMPGGDITLSASATGVDGNGGAFSAGPVQRTTVHGNPPAGTSVVSIALSANPVPKDLVGGRSGTLNWTLQNSTGVRANKLTLAMVIDSRLRVTSSAVTGSNSSDAVSCGLPTPGDAGTNVVFCNIDYLGGSSGGSGGSNTVTQLQVTVNYISQIVPSQTTLLATGYLSFDGNDSSNPVATGQLRVK